MPEPRPPSFAAKVWIATGVVALAAVVVGLVWYGLQVLLVAFGGIILAVALAGAANEVAARTPLGRGVSLAIVLLAVVAILGAAAWLAADQVLAEASELLDRVPELVGQLRAKLQQSGWGRFVLARLPDPSAIGSGQILGTVGATAGAVTNLLVALFVALYGAASPRPYVAGVIRLVPPRGRRRAAEVLAALARTLRRWLAGRLVGMLVIGVLTSLGLWLIGIRFALALGVLAALLNFVPYLGPVVSFAPPALLALLESPTKLLWVLALYLVVQTIESYLITPLVAQTAVALPPALTIVSQIVLGVVAGWMGLLLATPLVAVVTVLVRMLYVEDVLGDDLDRDVPPVRLRATG
jgi:predicted PurR-regulated permease PerM